MIDWKTTAFQIVNFLILLWLLKRFLFGRIVEAMDKREAGIAATIKDAEDREAEAKHQADEMARKNQEFDAQRDDMLAKAKGDADAHRKELTAQAREEVERTRARWHEAVEREKEAFLADLRQRATAQTCAIARRALADLATVGLESQMLDAFVGKVEGLDEAEQGRFAASAQGTEEEPGRVVVRSAFELPEAGRERLAALVHSRMAEDVEVSFETSADLICGIELAAAGTKLAWTVEDYLATLEENLAEALAETGPSPEEAPAATQGKAAKPKT